MIVPVAIDWDRDGDQDIILGGFNARGIETPIPLVNHWDDQSLPLIWLENTLDK